jgi:hypothetical protein
MQFPPGGLSDEECLTFRPPEDDVKVTKIWADRGHQVRGGAVGPAVAQGVLYGGDKSAGA